MKGITIIAIITVIIVGKHAFVIIVEELNIYYMTVEIEILITILTIIITIEISTTTIINLSNETTIGSKDQKAVDTVYCNTYIDNNPIYLIVNTGSTSSIISKLFLNSIERTIDEPL